MTEREFVHQLGIEVSIWLRPVEVVAEATNRPAALGRLLRAAGWQTSLPLADMGLLADAMVASLDQLKAAVVSIGTGGGGQLLDTAAQVKTLVTSVVDFKSQLASAVPQSSAVTSNEVELLVEDMAQLLTTIWLRKRDGLYNFCVATGILAGVETKAVGSGGLLERTGGVRSTLQPQRMLDLLNDPNEYLKKLHMPAGLTTTEEAVLLNVRLRKTLAAAVSSFGVSAQSLPGTFDTEEMLLQKGSKTLFRIGTLDETADRQFFVLSEIVPGTGSNRPALRLTPYGSAAIEATIGLGDFLASVTTTPFSMEISGDGVEILDPGSMGASLTARASAKYPIRFGIGSQGTMINLGAVELRVEAGVNEDAELAVTFVAANSSLSLSSAQFGAVDAIVGFDVTSEFDLGLSWSNRHGLRMAGSASMALIVGDDISIGGVLLLSGLRVSVELDNGLSVVAATNLRVSLGPARLTFDQLGLSIRIGRGSDPVEIQPNWPKGLGIEIEAGAVRGAGYLYVDPERGEYAGAAELTIGSVSVKAIGILTTKLPEGADG